MGKIVLLLLGALLLGGGAGWYGYASNRGSEPAVPTVNREMEELLAQVEAGAPYAKPTPSPVAVPSDEPATAAAPKLTPSPPPPELSLAPAASTSSVSRPPVPSASPPPPASQTPESSAAAPHAALDLNTATLEQLLTLPGIGESKGKAILELRSRLGAFRTVEQLKDVKGIGDKTLDKLRPLVRIGSS